MYINIYYLQIFVLHTYHNIVPSRMFNILYGLYIYTKDLTFIFYLFIIQSLIVHGQHRFCQLYIKKEKKDKNTDKYKTKHT
jgi:hypothetical protein